MKIGVIGLGPVGCTLAAHLQQAGARVIACDINPVVTAAISATGITLTHSIDLKVNRVPVCQTVAELEIFDPDLAIVAVKAPVMNAVFRELRKIDKGRLNVMCAQNGIDNEQAAAEIFGADRVLRMVINYAGNMVSGSTVFVSFFNPPNYIAALTETGQSLAHRLVDMLNAVNLNTEFTESIQKYVWEKAILNAALSAVCAITRRTMKDVMDFPHTLNLVEALIAESIEVARAFGIDLPENFQSFGMDYLRKAGHHRPSMLVDMEAGRKTEVGWLNGKIADYGDRAGIPTPVNKTLTVMIHLMEFPSGSKG